MKTLLFMWVVGIVACGICFLLGGTASEAFLAFMIGAILMKVMKNETN